MSTVVERLDFLGERGEISLIVSQYARFIQRMDPGCPGEVPLAAALAVHRMEEGNVCIDLNHEAGKAVFGGMECPAAGQWVESLEGSPCVGKPGDAAPLVLDESRRLYLQKYWRFEMELAERLAAMARAPAEPPDRPGVLAGEAVDWQNIAAYMALSRKLTVISGGPGTGKTTTVVKILELLAERRGEEAVALAAPTGKAAARLMESAGNREAVTIHKLLGARRGGGGFRYHAGNRLPYDLVIVDEASMVDLLLMGKLVEALPEHARLILLGDKDQLASVEAGAVLASICNYRENRFSESFITEVRNAGISIPDSCKTGDPAPLTDNIILLEKSYRFREDSGIGRFASAILQGKADEAVELLHSGTWEDIRHEEIREGGDFRELLLQTAVKQFETLLAGENPGEILEQMGGLGILCVHRRGPLGAGHVNFLVESLLREKELIPQTGDWYPGKPVMITRNDYSLGLRNGDVGIALPGKDGRLNVWFRGDKDSLRSFMPSRLANYETAFALTVHKSQGSEFGEALVILPSRPSPVTTRELLYTAVTRARNRCTLAGSREIIAHAIGNRAERASGLRDRLWG